MRICVCDFAAPQTCHDFRHGLHLALFDLPVSERKNF